MVIPLFSAVIVLILDHRFIVIWTCHAFWSRAALINEQLIAQKNISSHQSQLSIYEPNPFFNRYLPITYPRIKTSSATIKNKMIKHDGFDDKYTEYVCRNEDGSYLRQFKFYNVASLRCYKYLFPESKNQINDSWYEEEADRKNYYPFEDEDFLESSQEVSHKTNLLTDIIILNKNRLLFPTQHDSIAWLKCARASIDCCKQIKMPRFQIDSINVTKKDCPSTWDGWQCWQETKPGKVSYSSCSSYVYGSHSVMEVASYGGLAAKTCLSNGSWFQIYDPYNDRFKEWSNYSSCLDLKIFIRWINFRIGSYAISVSTIVPSLIIFLAYKSLKCHRVTLHMNLLTSLLTHSICVILFEIIIIKLTIMLPENPFIDENHILCKSFVILTKYTRTSSYFWMFCEGLHLHRLLSNSFRKEVTLIHYYIIGWVCPLFPLIIYALMRRKKSTEGCWILPITPLEWIINGVSFLSLLINLGFLCNIIKILLTRLRYKNQNTNICFKKTLKATMILIPLFGVQLLFIIYRPQSRHRVWELYWIICTLIDGLQGFLVALLYCLLNSEVIHHLHLTFVKWRNYSYKIKPPSNLPNRKQRISNKTVYSDIRCSANL